MTLLISNTTNAKTVQDAYVLNISDYVPASNSLYSLTKGVHSPKA